MFRPGIVELILYTLAIAMLVEADNQYSLPMLRNKVLSVKNRIECLIIEFLQRALDNFPGVTLIVAMEYNSIGLILTD